MFDIVETDIPKRRTKQTQLSGKICSFILLVGGFAAIFGGSYMFSSLSRKYLDLSAREHTAEGIILGHKRGMQGGGYFAYGFTDNGKEYESHGAPRGGGTDLAVGQAITVYFDASNPAVSSL